MTCANLSLKKRIEINDTFYIANIYGYIARIFLKKNDFKTAHEYLIISCNLFTTASTSGKFLVASKSTFPSGT